MLTNTQVLRDSGGILVRSPGNIRSTMDPAIQETDPRFGPQAALAAFDATFASSLYYEHNDRALNNEFFGGGTRNLRQRAAVFQAQIAKKTPFGSEFAIRHNVEWDRNNAPGNKFPAAWDINYEAEFRQNLLQGGGTDFGRIAGTSETPGVYNGILIARTNTDISIADFESSVRDSVSDVENAYWDLYFAYRDLDARVAARDASLETWRRVQALKERKRVGGEADKEAEAREQYYRFQEEVENSLSGKLVDGTRTFNGSAGGTFRSTGGVHVCERRLRYLIGLPVTGNRLLRPADEPTRAEILFDWQLCLEEALVKRSELRRQKWMIKRRELELIASRNFLMPELDVVALYRWRGLGRQILSDRHDMSDRSAYGALLGGNMQESQLGVELAFPFGNRQAHAGVRNAEFLLAREQALLREQEERVVHDLSNAFADVDRAYHVLQTVYNRREAARDRLKALQAAYSADKAPLNFVLDAQRRLAASQINYYQALLEYNTSVRNVHYEKGTLLEYTGVHLSEGPWPGPAYGDAIDRLQRRVPLHGESIPGHPVISNGQNPY
ncbi:MAG: TolC family protein [Planctomycetaceae bacterium]|nr:TolC family protein [Planctomycetaceae bacterium]